MKGTIPFFITVVAFPMLFIACSPKGEHVRPVSKDEPFSCTNCIVQGSLYDGETLEPLAFKEVALYAKKWGDKTADDPYITTDENGFFRIQYIAADTVAHICLYPRPKQYEQGKSYDCIAGSLPMGKHMPMGRIYTSVKFE